jgi:hypothetical protein
MQRNLSSAKQAPRSLTRTSEDLHRNAFSFPRFGFNGWSMARRGY